MKGIYSVAILYVAIFSVAALNELPVADIPHEILTECPKVNPGNKTVFVPHESDCTKFYSCHMGKKGKPLNCPLMDNDGNRLHFNPKLQVCDWPWDAGCQVSSSTSTTTSSSISTSITTQSTSSIPTTPSTSSLPPTTTTTTPSPPPPTTTTPSPPPSTTTTPSPPPPTTTTPSPPPPTTTTPSPPPPTTTTPSPPPPTTTTPSPPPPTTTTPSPPPPTTTTPSPPPPTTTTPSPPPPTTTTPSPPPPTTTTPSPPPPTTTTPSPPPPTTTTPSPPPPTTTTPSPPPPTTTTPSPPPPTTTTPSPPPPTTTTPSPPPPTTTTPSFPTSPTTTSSSPTLTTPSLNSCEFDDRIHMLPHKTMCDHYYSCFNGMVNPIPKKCERNLLFNPILRVCDYPENVNCSNIPPSITPSTIHSLITTSMQLNPSSTLALFPSISTKSIDLTASICIRNGKTYKIPHEIMCNYYYWCADGIKSIKPIKCEDGYLFNPLVGECDYPENVDCNDRSTPSRGTTITTATPSKTTTKKSPTTTTESSITTTKKSTITTTESSTTTKKSTITTTSETPTTRDSSKPRENCPPKGSIQKARIAHPCLCNQYYECIDGEKILKRCPIGKHFDYVREVCDWAAKVKCIRPIPTFDILMDDYNIPYSTCGPEGRAFQHDTDCSAYYLCSNGEKILEHCIEGLHFNMTIQTCDYPQKTCDLNRTLSTISLNTCPPPGSIENILLPHECECTQYYECVGGKQVLRACPSGLHFDGVRQICNNPTEVKCIADITSTTPKTESTTTKAIDKPRITCPPKGSSESARYPHPCLCNQYYECVEGDKILRTCPIGMHFDDAKEVCDWANKVKCIQSLSSHDILISEDDTKCSPNGRRLQHEFDCTEYYLCLEGKKILKSCVEGLHFNVTIQMCDYPTKKCDLAPLLPKITLDICPSAGSVEKVLFAHECECAQYYECIDGKQVLRDCPDGLYYNYVRQICSEPTEVKCATLAPKVSTKRPNIPNSDLSCYDEDSEIPHEYDCRLYYKCSNGEKILKTCPRNLYFNPKLRVCDFPENVICDAGSANGFTTSTPNKCSTTTGITKIAHETDCNLYYVCENGISALKKCHSPELVFNPILKVCDFPENYICNVTRAKNDFEKTAKTIQNLDPSTCIGTCPEEDPEYAVFLPNDDCKKFCMCSGGVAWVQSCPEPLYFDSVHKVCKRKKDAVCAKRLFSQDNDFIIHNIADNDDNSSQLLSENDNEKREIYNSSKLHFYNLDPSTCIGTCPEEDPEYAVLLPNDDCKKFCLCSNGLAYVLACPEPLYFDSVDKVCKRKKAAVCAKRSLDLSLTDGIFNEDFERSLSEESYNDRSIYYNPWYKRRFYNADPCIGICPEENSKYAVLLPHEDCRKFCICNNGLAYVQQCPRSLYFHSMEKVCKQRRYTACAITINTENDEDDSIEYLSDESNERRRYNYMRLKPPFHSFSSSTCSGICSEDDSIYTILYPHKDCKKFCLCSNGVTWVQSCPEPLYFDSIHKVCKQKRDAICAFSQNHVVTIDREVNNKERIEFRSEENDEIYNSWYKLYFYNYDTSTCIDTCSDEDSNYVILFPNLDCKKFCICSNGVTWVQSCPDLLYFDSMDKICKLKRNAICAINPFNKNRPFMFNKVDDDNSLKSPTDENNKERSTYNNLDPSTCIGTCPEEDPEYAVFLPNDDCKKFCMCSGGVAWVQSCPEPLYFDSVQKICKRKKDAVCAKRSFSQDNTFTIATVIDNDNLLKSPTDENNERNTYDNLDPSTCIGTCPEEDPEYAVFLPNDDCKKFCMCSGGVAWVQSCPEPLYFDSVQKICKRKKDAVCAKRLFIQDNTFTIATVIDNDNSLKSPTDENNERNTYDNLDPSTCIGTCPEEDPEYAVFLPNDDCKKFCMCSGGVAWVQSCPEPLYFDSVQKICKRKKDAVCAKRLFIQDNTFTIATVIDNDNSLKSPTNENNNERNTYDNLDPSTCIGTCPEEDPEYAVFLPNDDCKKFCMCSGGVAWVQSCPEPLYFDSVQKICKRKKDAVCAKRR